MTTDKENAEKLVIEYEQLKGQIEALQEGISMIDSSLIQMDTTIEALTGAGSTKKDNEILLPVGSDSFLWAKITDNKNAIVGIGAGVAVKKTLKEAVAEIEGRKKELEKIRAERTDTFEKTLLLVQEMTPKIQEIMNKAQKEG
jgi:prefoldin alpha subunit